ncbi:hypothetical protein AK812_SmicGene18034 [Symbiodinium microadriaticum]|uniref:C3H1-type domain-containing protein n=1 Tax=Symbiodinium microadriaticum TaxID=2951 RepID=A0A1Q9DW60_SYMMI|nr:hypothetical protein AK812_SmicGene18034 [Symbiodinium microadriaticum]
MMKVVYRRSFIDVDDEEESPAPSIFRSRSAPPARDRELQWDAESDQVNRELEDLAQRAQELLPVLVCGYKDEASDNEDTATATTATQSSTVLEGSDSEPALTESTPTPASDMCETRIQVDPDAVNPAPPLDPGSNGRQAELDRDDADPASRFNRGSRGHPEVCGKPCIFFSLGKCENGDMCGYCHLRHQRPHRPTLLSNGNQFH